LGLVVKQALCRAAKVDDSICKLQVIQCVSKEKPRRAVFFSGVAVPFFVIFLTQAGRSVKKISEAGQKRGPAGQDDGCKAGENCCPVTGLQLQGIRRQLMWEAALARPGRKSAAA
jgi:hypothetical protein